MTEKLESNSKRKQLELCALDHLLDNVRYNDWAIVISKATPEVAAYLVGRLKRRQQRKELLRKIRAPMIDLKPITVKKYEV